MAEETVVPGLPNEIFLTVIEWCDVETYVNLRLVNKSTKNLIDIFEKPLATAIAEQEPGYQNTIAHRGTIPRGVELRRRLRRRQTVHEICDLFVNGIILKFGYPVPNLGHVEEKLQAAPGTEAYIELYRCVENGCAVSWTLTDIWKDVKTSVDNNMSIRQAAFDHHFHRQIKSRYVTYLQSLKAFEVLSFRFFYLMKKAYMSISGEAYKTTITSILAICTLASPTRMRRSSSRVSHQARRWTHWFSLTQTTPLSMLGYAKEASARPRLMSEPIKKMALEKLCLVYSNTSDSNRASQCDIAETFLDMVDEQVSQDRIRPSEIMPTAFSVLPLHVVLRHRWPEPSFDNDILWLG